jgi:hypothetical protein
LDKGTKSAKKKKTTKKKMRDQSEFGFLGHQVCLGTIQLEGKRQIILPISNEGISHTKGGDFGESIEQKKKNKKSQKHDPHNLFPSIKTCLSLYSLTFPYTHINTLYTSIQSLNKKKHKKIM